MGMLTGGIYQVNEFVDCGYADCGYISIVQVNECADCGYADCGYVSIVQVNECADCGYVDCGYISNVQVNECDDCGYVTVRKLTMGMLTVGISIVQVNDKRQTCGLGPIDIDLLDRFLSPNIR